MELWVAELGTVEYGSALDLQEGLISLRRESKIPDTLLLLEHPHVYTTGRRYNPSHLIMNSDDRVRFGIDLFHTDRGGEMTYHGPGQLIGYPIMEIQGIPMIRLYLKSLEEVLIKAVAAFGIDADRIPGCPGVWVGLEKLASIGLRVSNGITKHGFALNVSTDLSYFEGIIPCGFFDRGVTSMKKLLGIDVPLPIVGEAVIESFGKVFGRKLTVVGRDEILNLTEQ